MEVGKPVRASYLNNLQHKEKQMRKVWLYMCHAMSDQRAYLYDGNWNHKKTNAQKAMWSCGGYGGKCPSCKRSRDYGNKKEKMGMYEFDGVMKKIA